MTAALAALVWSVAAFVSLVVVGSLAILGYAIVSAVLDDRDKRKRKARQLRAVE